jgi:hypothetical protein
MGSLPLTCYCGPATRELIPFLLGMHYLLKKARNLSCSFSSKFVQICDKECNQEDAKVSKGNNDCFEYETCVDNTVNKKFVFLTL